MEGDSQTGSSWHQASRGPTFKILFYLPICGGMHGEERSSLHMLNRSRPNMGCMFSYCVKSP